ncbi:hypothetical protein VPHD526_0019 [Vibrio phage D526]
MNESTLRNLSNQELLKAVDRKNPEVKELAERLEKLRGFLDAFGKNMQDALVYMEDN